MDNLEVNEITNFEEGSEQVPSVGQTIGATLGLTFLAGVGAITGCDFGSWTSKKISKWWNKKED